MVVFASTVVVVDSGGSVGGTVVDCSIVVLGAGAACVVVVLRPSRFGPTVVDVAWRCVLLDWFPARLAPPPPAVPARARVVELPSEELVDCFVPSVALDDAFFVSTVFGFDELSVNTPNSTKPRPIATTAAPTAAMIKLRRC